MLDLASRISTGILVLLPAIAGLPGHGRAQEGRPCISADLLPGAADASEVSPVVTPAGRLCLGVAIPEQGRVPPDGPDPDQATIPSAVSPGRAFLYSALVPGAGQRLLGQGRWPPYVAVEIWGWIQFFLRHDRGHSLAGRYRDLAWNVARRVSVGAREDGDFGYYEALTHFQSSGAFDRDPLEAGVQPETSLDTFNGSVWELAKEIFFPPDVAEPPSPGSPPYDRALAYYLERSVTPRFAWNWGDNSLQHSVYTDLIHQSDEAFRSSTTMIGLILANHVISAIDALVSARLRDMGRDPESLRLEPLVRGPRGTWGFTLRIRR